MRIHENLSRLFSALPAMAALVLAPAAFAGGNPDPDAMGSITVDSSYASQAGSVEKKKEKRRVDDSRNSRARVDSMAMDTTLILGTPGSPTTRGVPGTGIEEKR